MSCRVVCVILNYNDFESVVKLVNRIESYKSIDNIVIVDNCSNDKSFEILSETSFDDKVHLIVSDKNGGYGYGNNYGMRYAFAKLSADYVLICNPDVLFSEELVIALSSRMNSDNTIGCASAIQLDRNGREILHASWMIPKKKNYSLSLLWLGRKIFENYYISLSQLRINEYCYVDCVPGSLLMLSKNAFEKTGGYDESIFLYCEETVLGKKIKDNDLKTVVLSKYNYTHYHGVTINKNIKSIVKRQKTLIRSHHYVLKRYLNANSVELVFDRMFCFISLMECVIKQLIHK